MDETEIYQTLAKSKTDQMLINVYQLESDDFYTGVVTALDQEAVVLATVNENGIKDGFVLVRLRAVSDVETSSRDLISMAFRMQTVTQRHFLVPDFLYRTLTFDDQKTLLNQVLALVYREKQMVLFALKGHSDYYEGILKNIGHTLGFAYFNRFDYAQSKDMIIDQDAVEVIEFGGLDLFLGKLLLVSKPSHHPLVKIETSDLLPMFLQRAMSEQMLVSVQPKDVVNNFFVGYISRMDQSSILMSLLDMTGQFGGYVLLRFSEIESIAADSDYVNTIGFYEQENRQRGLLIQPVLRQPWPIKSFRLWPDMVSFAQDNNRLLRIRFEDDSQNSYLGYVSDFDSESFDFHILDDADQLTTMTLDLSNCVEIAFNYLNSYLLEQEYRTK